MTNNIADLHVEILGDIQDCLTVFLQQQFPLLKIPPKQSAAWIRLPLRSTLLQSPGNKTLSTVEKKLQSLFLSPQEVWTIETYTTNNHLRKEAALIALIKLSLQDHKLLREIARIRQASRRATKDIQVKIDIELVEPMSWHEKHPDDTTV